MSVEEFLGIRRHVALKHVRGVQLPHQLDGFILGRSVVAQTRRSCIPHVLHFLSAVQSRDEVIGGRSEAMMATRSPIVEDVPELTAIMVTPELSVTAYAWRQLSDPVPMWTEK